MPVPAHWKLTGPLLEALLDVNNRALTEISDYLGLKFKLNVEERKVLGKRLRQACNLLVKAKMLAVIDGDKLCITKRGIIALRRQDYPKRRAPQGGDPGHWDPKPVKGYRPKGRKPPVREPGVWPYRGTLPGSFEGGKRR